MDIMNNVLSLQDDLRPEMVSLAEDSSLDVPNGDSSYLNV